MRLRCMELYGDSGMWSQIDAWDGVWLDGACNSYVAGETKVV